MKIDNQFEYSQVNFRTVMNFRDWAIISGVYKYGEGTLPWAIFLFRIFSNYLSHKFEKKQRFEKVIT